MSRNNPLSVKIRKVSYPECPKPGQALAIFGPSGAGKSSLVNVLLRFWDYQQGELKLGGHSLREFSPNAKCWPRSII
jgi:ABC-type multidrug transport system fused ATPase/permease subunit